MKTYDQLQAIHALDKQLRSATIIVTDHGDLKLDEELRIALVAALKPILEERAAGGKKSNAMALHIVQLKDCHEFLCPSPDGDVTSTPLLNKAGVFDSLESAIDTANHYCGEDNYDVIPVSNLMKPTYQ